TCDVEHHDLAGEAGIVEGDEETSAITGDAQELWPDDWHIGDGEGSKVEHRRRSALSSVDQIELVVRHTRREGTVVAIMGDELDTNRTSRLRRVADSDCARDRALRQIPHPHTAAQEDTVPTGDVQGVKRTDEVTRHHQVM